MTARTRSQKQRDLETPRVRVSQIIVQIVVLDQHDAPINADPLVFVGNENGTAADNLAAWLADLPAQLETAGAPPVSEAPGA